MKVGLPVVDVMNEKFNPDIWRDLEKKQSALFEIRVTPHKMQHLRDLCKGYRFMRMEPLFKHGWTHTKTVDRISGRNECTSTPHTETGLLLKVLEPEGLDVLQHIEKTTTGPDPMLTLWVPYGAKPHQEAVIDMELIGEIVDKWTPYIDIIKDVTEDDIEKRYSDLPRIDPKVIWTIRAYKGGHYDLALSVSGLLANSNATWSIDSRGQVWLKEQFYRGEYYRAAYASKELYDVIRIRLSVMKFVNDAIEGELKKINEARRIYLKYEGRFPPMIDISGPATYYFTDTHIFNLLPNVNRDLIRDILKTLSDHGEEASFDKKTSRPPLAATSQQAEDGKVVEVTYQVLRPIKEEDFKARLIPPSLNYMVLAETASLANDIAEEADFTETDNSMPSYLALNDATPVFMADGLRVAMAKVINGLAGLPALGLPLDITSWEIQDRIFTETGLRYPLDMIHIEAMDLYEKQIITYVSKTALTDELEPTSYLFVRAPKTSDFGRLPENVKVFYEPQREGAVLFTPKGIIATDVRDTTPKSLKFEAQRHGFNFLPEDAMLYGGVWSKDKSHVHAISPRWSSENPNPKLDLLIMALDASLENHRKPSSLYDDTIVIRVDKMAMDKPGSYKVEGSIQNDTREPCPFEKCRFVGPFPQQIMKEACPFRCPPQVAPSKGFKPYDYLLGDNRKVIFGFDKAGNRAKITIIGEAAGLVDPSVKELEKISELCAIGKPQYFKTISPVQADDMISIQPNRQKETVAVLRQVYSGILYRTWVKTHKSGRVDVVLDLNNDDRIRYLIGRDGLIIFGGIRAEPGEVFEMEEGV